MDSTQTTSSPDRLAAWAAETAERRAQEFGARWSHVQAVVRRAEAICACLTSDEDREHLIAAAYLHDVGYCPSLNRTKFHPYDGAIFVRAARLERLAGLVAHHSGADWDAELLNRTEDLRGFELERSPVADALTYCDLTTGPAGESMTVAERTADVIERYGTESISARAMSLARSDLEAAVQRTENLIGGSTGHRRG